MTSTICKAVKANLYLLAASLYGTEVSHTQISGIPISRLQATDLSLVSRTNDPTKWQRAYDAADEAIKYAESAGQRAMFTDDFVVSGFDLDRIYIPGDVDDEFRHAVWRLRYMLWCGAGEGNTEGIHEIYGQKMHSFQYPLWYAYLPAVGRAAWWLWGKFSDAQCSLCIPDQRWLHTSHRPKFPSRIGVV